MTASVPVGPYPPCPSAGCFHGVLLPLIDEEGRLTWSCSSCSYKVCS